MRKLLFTTAIILPLAAGPVLAQDSTTGTPMTETPAETPAAEAPATDMTTPDPAATETPSTAAPAADPAAEAEAAAAEAEAAAAAAEVAASGKVAQQQAANELRVDWITGTNVTAPDGTSIGRINDLIVDGQTGDMIAAIVGVGGFLGIGAKQIAVPFEQLTINYDAQEITSSLTKEEADAAAEYVFRERESAPAPADGGMAAPADTAPAAPAGTAPAD